MVHSVKASDERIVTSFTMFASESRRTVARVRMIRDIFTTCSSVQTLVVVETHQFYTIHRYCYCSSWVLSTVMGN